jgi:hypothetical protein
VNSLGSLGAADLVAATRGVGLDDSIGPKATGAHGGIHKSTFGILQQETLVAMERDLSPTSLRGYCKGQQNGLSPWFDGFRCMT